MAFLVSRLQQPPADLDPCRIRFGRADQAGGGIPVDLGELIPVDVGLAAAGFRRVPRPSGHSTAKIAPAVISANTNHNVIKGSGGAAPETADRCAALHHRRQARQLTIAAETAANAHNPVTDRRAHLQARSLSPPRDDLRSPVSALSAARLISDE